MQIDPKILKPDEEAAYALRSLYRRLGYTQYKMSKFEEYALYIRNKDFLVSDGIISFTDTNGRLLALKPDVTLSIINNSKDVPGQIQKLYYDENVYRISRSSHTFKEIRQIGLECIGAIDLPELCEVLLLALRSLKSISEHYIFELSHMGLLEAVLAERQIGEADRKTLLTCISQKNADGLAELGADPALSVFMKTFDSFAAALEALEPLCQGVESAEKLNEFRQLLTFLEEMNAAQNTRVDFSLTNDMSYYSGIAFRGYIKGIPVGILSGGQYDKLMQKLGRSSGAVGFAVYLDSLERLNRDTRDYDVDILLRAKDSIAAALKAAETLSADGTSVRVCREVPEGLRYRQLLEIAEKGGETGGNN